MAEVKESSTVWKVDRIEGDIAVIEAGIYPDIEFLNIPVKLLPKGITEGDMLEVKTMRESQERMDKKFNKLMDSLFEE